MQYNIYVLIIYFIALGLLLFTYFFVGQYFLRKYYRLKKNEPNNKELYLVSFIYGLIFIIFPIGRIFFTIFDFMTEFNVPENWTLENLIIWKIGSILQIFSIGLLVFLIEKRVMHGKDKYVIFFIHFTFFVIGVFSPDLIMATLFFFLATIFILYLPIAYGYIAIISDGVIRKKAIYALVGIIILLLGIWMLDEYILVLIVDAIGFERMLIHAISHFIKIVGVILFFMGLK